MDTKKESRRELEKMFVAEMKEFTKYLSENSSNLPFRMADISKALHLPFSTVKDYFDIVKGSFTLYAKLQTEAKKIGSPTKKHSRKSVHSTLKLKLNELQLLSDFNQLSSIRSIPEDNFPKNLLNLKKKHPYFFSRNKLGWITSKEAQFYAEQYTSFKRLNMTPEKIQFQNKILLVIS